MPDRLLSTTRLAVRWGDMDALGHVNNAAYLTYVEQGRIEWLESLGDGIDGLRTSTGGPVLARAEVQFRRPVVYPATVIVQTYAARMGHTSFTIRSEITVEGDEGGTYAEALATIVWLDSATGRPTPPPDAVRAAMDGESA